MKGFFTRRWRNDHEGCAWCERTALTFEIDGKGEKVGACRAHRAQLVPIQRERVTMMQASTGRGMPRRKR